MAGTWSKRGNQPTILPLGIVSVTLVMGQSRTTQCGVDECGGVVIGGPRRRGEGHAAPPILRRFGMSTTQDHPALTTRSFDDCRCSIGILADYQSSTGKLRTVFPIMFDDRCIGAGDRHCCLMDASIHECIEVEFHIRCQVQAVALGFAGQKPAGANPQIVDTPLHGRLHSQGCRGCQAKGCQRSATLSARRRR